MLLMRGQGWILIGLFWTSFGFLMIPNTGDATPAASVGFTFLGAVAWAALTVPLFAVTERFELTNEEGSWRWIRVAGLLAFGMVVAVVVAYVLALLSAQLLRPGFSGRLAGPEGVSIMLDYRIPHDVLACHLVLAAGVARDYMLRYRTRLAEATVLRSQLTEARLEVLRAQLNPHFLFNALNAVAALVQRDPAGARRMIALLSDLLRQSLDGSAEPEVPLERELEMLRRYLAIMEVRFRGTLETRIEIAPDALHAMVPALILQPLVENALKHGVSKARGVGVVEVTALKTGDDLRLAVRNSGGAGTWRPDVAAVGRREGGFGLRHTRERLRQLYGDRGILELTPSPDGGTVAEILLPFRLAPGAGDRPSEVEPRESAVSGLAAHG